MPVTAETDSGATATTRQGAFWAAEVAVGNATAPWAGEVSAVAVKTVSGSPDLIRTDTRAAYLPAHATQGERLATTGTMAQPASTAWSQAPNCWC